MSFWKTFTRNFGVDKVYFSLAFPDRSVLRLSQSLMINRFVEQNQEAVFIFRDQQELLTAYEQVKLLGPVVSERILLMRYFDSWGRDRFGDARDLVGERLRSLVSREQNLRSPPIWFTTPLGMISRNLPPDILRDQLITIEKDAHLDQDDLIRRLAKFGYREVEEVSGALEFSIRGSIFDVFPNSSEFPFRIELLGDLVCSVRQFNVSNQRSSDDHSEVWIPAAGEANASWSLKDRAQKIYEILITAGVEKHKITSIVDAVHSGHYFNGYEVFYPALRDRSTTLFSMTEKAPKVFTFDPVQLMRGVVDGKAELVRKFEVDTENGVPTISPDFHFDWSGWNDPGSEVINLKENADFTISASELAIEEQGIATPFSDRCDYWSDIVLSKYDCGISVFFTCPYTRFNELKSFLSIKLAENFGVSTRKKD